MCRLIRLFGRFGRYAVPLIGLALVAGALTAGLTGADPEGNWGPARRQTLGLGIAVLVCFAVAAFWPAVDRRIVSLWRSLTLRCRVAWARLRRREWIALVEAAARALAPVGARAEPARRLLRRIVETRERRVFALALFVFILAVPIYIWIGSVGFWTRWPGTTSYYNDLADSFRNGQLHLLTTPDPELLALDDPYDPRQRGQIPFLWDVVLYGGRFYLYWGPVPALLVSGWRAFIPGPVGDNVLVLLFTLGTIFFTLLLLAEAFTRFFPNLGARLALAPFLVAAFAHPLPWLMSGPAIYEASIAAGQAFLVGALYFGVRSLLGRGRPMLGLSLAGLMLACGVGSKGSLAPAALSWAAFGVIATLRAGRLAPHPRRRGCAALSLLVPFALGIACLGWYNAARFGSPFEFGVRYQLTGMDLDRDYSDAFSVLNVPINLYTYALTGVEPVTAFPWVLPVLGHTSPPPLAWASLHIPGAEGLTPSLYYAEQVTGLLYALPFAVFSLVAFVVWIGMICPPEDAHGPATPSQDPGAASAARLGMALAVGGALAFAPTLTFAFATARYAADVVPTLTLISALGVWGLLSSRRAAGQTTWWVSVAAWLLGATSIVMSLLLAFTGYQMRFERLHFDLYSRIVELLSW